MRVTPQELHRVLTHEDAHVVLGLGEQSVRVDELEAVSRRQGIPLVHVAVHQHGTFVVMRVDAAGRAPQRVIDCAPRARTVGIFPGRRDELDEPPALRRAGRKARDHQHLRHYCASTAPSARYSGAMATIQVRDVPDEVAEIYRRRAQASGKSLQSYMREQLIAMARRRDKAEVMAIVEQALEHDPAPGLSADTIRAGLRELRGE